MVVVLEMVAGDGMAEAGLVGLEEVVVEVTVWDF